MATHGVVELRKHLGWSQQSFASSLGLSIRAIANYEAGKIPNCRVQEILVKAAQDCGREDIAYLMATHAKLPDERTGIVHHFTIGGRGPTGLSGYITAGLYPDGALGEVFLTVNRTGGHERGMANTLAVMISMALQHGVPLDKIVSKLKGMTFEPQGPTENPAIPWCKSLADYLGRWLEQKFLQSQKETGGGQAGSATPHEV
jgi:hypothetical protein